MNWSLFYDPRFLSGLAVGLFLATVIVLVYSALMVSKLRAPKPPKWAARECPPLTLSSSPDGDMRCRCLCHKKESQRFEPQDVEPLY